MRSLQDLNNHSQTSLDITDSRGSKVNFERVFPLQPLDIVGTISAITVSVPPAGNEIVEIINYGTAATRFRVRIITGGSPALTGSTLNFGTLPAHLTLTSASGVYTISGIKTVSDWDVVKYFVWNLPANFATCPLWYLDIAVVYYDSVLGEDVTVDWEAYDPRFYYIAKLSSEFTQATIIGSIKKFTAALTSSTSLDCPGSRVFRFQANMTAISSLTANGLDLDLASASITARFTVAVVPQGLLKNPGAKTLTSAITMVANVIKYTAITNMTTSRSYYKNVSNAIFASTTPFIEDPTPLASSFTITLTSANGQFGTTYASSSTYTFTGTMAEVNAQFANILFFPTKDYTSNTSFTYTQSKNGVTQKTITSSLNYAGLGSLPSYRLYKISTAGSGTWNPLREDKLYFTQCDILIVGGGGGAGGSTGNGGGGGGGAAYEYPGITIPTNISYTIGAGGAVNNAGGTTTFTPYTANGGNAGGSIAGGSSGTGFSGGSGQTSGAVRGGGGGGGAGTTNPPYPSNISGVGGAGVVSFGDGIGGEGGDGFRSFIETNSAIYFKMYANGGYGTTMGASGRPYEYDEFEHGGPGSGGFGRWASTVYPSNPAYNKAATGGKDGAVIIKVY